MSMSLIANTTAYQRILDLINYTNLKNIGGDQITVTELTELPYSQQDAFGRNTSIVVRAVNRKGYRNLPPFQNGITLKYRRMEISENASTPKLTHDITPTTTWDQFTLLISNELGVPREECSNYTQEKLNEPGTAYVAPHTRSNKLSVVIGTNGGYLGNGNNVTLISNSLLLLPSAIVVVARLV